MGASWQGCGKAELWGHREMGMVQGAQQVARCLGDWPKAFMIW